jgi:hypothetical protein
VDGYLLYPGDFEWIPAVQMSDDIMSVSFEASDEGRVMEQLKWQSKSEAFVTLPENPPIAASSVFDMCVVRVRVPMIEKDRHKNLDTPIYF